MQLANDNFAQAVIVTTSTEARERLRARLDAAMPDRFPDIITRTFPLEVGPPVGWPLQYRVSGPDPRGVRSAAFRAAQAVASELRARLINFDWNEPAKSIRLALDQDQVRRLGRRRAASSTTGHGAYSIVDSSLASPDIRQFRLWGGVRR